MTELSGVMANARAFEVNGEVSADAMQLITIATFNGLCHLINAVGAHGMLDVDRLAKLHDAMASPLDDENCRDDEFLVSVSASLDDVLADVMKLVRSRLRLDK